MVFTVIVEESHFEFPRLESGRFAISKRFQFTTHAKTRKSHKKDGSYTPFRSSFKRHLMIYDRILKCCTDMLPGQTYFCFRARHRAIQIMKGGNIRVFKTSLMFKMNFAFARRRRRKRGNSIAQIWRTFDGCSGFARAKNFSFSWEKNWAFELLQSRRTIALILRK